LLILPRDGRFNGLILLLTYIGHGGIYLKFDGQLIEIITRVHDVSSFRFIRPSGLDYKPGQYMFATINVAGRDLMHPFSFSSSPTEEGFIEFTKKFTDSEYSQALKSLKPGDKIEIDAPYGQFTFTGEYPKICMLAGGIGITPFWSICKYCADKKISAKLILIYGNRQQSDIAFYEDLNTLQMSNSKLNVFFVLTQPNDSWQGLTGIINADLIKKQVDNYQEYVYYVCGPPVMVEAMKKVIKELGLPIDKLKLEALSGHT